MPRRKLSWIRTTIPERTKIKLWRLMIANTTYPGWCMAIDAEHNKYQEREDTASRNDIESYSVFDRFDIKFVASSRETYNLLYEEIMQMPLDFVIKLPPDLQDWVKQLRPELEAEKYPRRKTEVTEMTSLSEKYLIEHYQKLRKLLQRFCDQLCTPKLSELCLLTLELPTRISYSYGEIADMRYQKGAITLDIEVSDPFLWECLKEHLTAEFPKFSENLGDWKRDMVTLVEGCHDITKTIADQLAKMGAKMGWNFVESDLDPASEHYGPGVFYHILVDLMYKCVMAHHLPEFQRVSDSHDLSILVMDYSTGRKGIARGESTLLDQVEQHCVGMTSDDALKKKVRKVLKTAEQLDGKQEPIRKKIRLVLERGTFKGTCSVCSDLVSQGPYARV